MTRKPEMNTAAAEPAIVSIKGFNRNWTCRDFQYAIGDSYEHAGEVKACETGFHGIGPKGHPLEVFGYYAPATSRYAEVRQSGALSRHGSDGKVASARIAIVAEITMPDLIGRAIKWVMDRAKPEGGSSATGYQGAASATGGQGAASATGSRGAASATGYQGAASATGYQGVASATGSRGAASATGSRGAASATGDWGAASATGEQGAASATGNWGAASATGDWGAASATGYQGAASATGDWGAASATGYHSIAVAGGYECKAMVAKDCALFLVSRDNDTGAILHVWAGIAGRGGIKPMTWYRLDDDGQLVEVA